MENLKKWRFEIKSRMPLLLYGARQVGKTYAMQELGANEFKNTIYVNFEADRTIGSFFESNIHPDAVIKVLEKYFHNSHT